MAELRCGHDKLIWRNYGDGKTRHMTDDGRPLMVVCDKDGIDTTHPMVPDLIEED